MPSSTSTVASAIRVLDVRPLTPGQHVRLCTDLDGAGPQRVGPAGPVLYVSPAASADGRPLAVQPDPRNPP